MLRIIPIILILIPSLFLTGVDASPQQQTKTAKKYKVGTGFFVSKLGYVVTNNHVINGCKEVFLNTDTGLQQTKIKAVDSTNDLALLQTSYTIPRIAPMRYNQTFKRGDEVVIIGFPGQNAIRRTYQVRSAFVVDTKGPQGEANWLQFTDAARHGNSGGPLLDGSGNVIGVVTAKVTLFEHDHPENIIQKSDVAVNMPILKHFLQTNHVRFDQTISYHSDLARKVDLQHAANVAKDFIVPIVCPEEE